MRTGLSCNFILSFHAKRSQSLISVQGVYSQEKWTKPNPLLCMNYCCDCYCKILSSTCSALYCQVLNLCCEITSLGLWIVAIYIKESSLWHQLDRNQKLPFPFFQSWSPSSPYVSWLKLLPAVWTMAEKRKDNGNQKNLSRQQLVCAASLMHLLPFEWFWWNVLQTFEDCSQTNQCRVVIFVAN